MSETVVVPPSYRPSLGTDSTNELPLIFGSASLSPPPIASSPSPPQRRHSLVSRLTSTMMWIGLLLTSAAATRAMRHTLFPNPGPATSGSVWQDRKSTRLNSSHG